MPLNQSLFRNTLVADLDRLKTINARFSLRGLSKKTGVAAGPLSQILNGKRNISEKMALQISEALEWTSDIKGKVFFSSLETSSELEQTTLPTTILEEDQFSMISEWYHYAILSLMQVKGFRAQPQWIAARLGISENQSQLAIERMVRLGIIKRLKNGRLSMAKRKLSVNGEVPNEALKRAHRQGFELATKSLLKHSLDQREFNFLVVPTNPVQMKKAKIFLRKMQNDLCELLMNTTDKTDVYRFAYQLYPLGESPDETETK